MLPAVADDLGLEPGVAVITGTPDLHSAAAGAGAVLAYQPHLAISTTSWLSCPFPGKKTDPIRQMATVPGILPGLNLVANNQDSGGGALAWLQRCLADGGAIDSYDRLTAQAAEAEPGSGGVIFTPWLAGERSPVDNRAARAGFHNLSLQTTRAQLVRAVLEGVAFNARWLCEGVERFVGRSLGPIRAVGGGATSPLWCSIYASILDRPIEQVADPVHANLRGAALLAGIALGAVGAEEIGSLVQVAGHLPSRPADPPALRPDVRRVPRPVFGPTRPVQAPQPRALTDTGRQAVLNACAPDGNVSAGPGLPEQEPLGLVAAHRPHRPELRLGLDPFGHHLEPELVGQVDHGGDDGGILPRRAEPGHEAPIDLQPVDGQTLQVQQR